MLNNIDEMEFFSIGEFAKICGTTRATLYHYEKIGLLIPKTNEVNSYRSYKLYDYYLFMYIAHLTRIGFSLYEIREYVHNKTCDNYIDAQKNSYIRMSLQQEKIQLKNERTQRGLHSLHKSLEHPLNQPQITYREQEHYLRMGFEGSLNGKSCIEAQAKLRDYAELPDINIERNFLGFYSDESVSAKTPSFGYVLSKMIDLYPCEYLFTRPSGTYISMYYRGPFTPDGDNAYKIIADYMEEHRFTAQSGIFVEDIVGPFISYDKSEYVSLMYIKIE